MKTYSREEALAKSIEYFNGDDLAAEVFVTKYAMRNDKLEIVEPTPEFMHRRLAKEFARIEKKYPNPMSEEEIFGLFDRFKHIIPQGSPMFGIGNFHQKTSLGNCFVLNLVDSYGGICRMDERIAQISKRRGGAGADISPLRPKGLPTKNSALTTDGIVVFMERFSNTAREVAQCIAGGQKVLTKRGLVNIEDVIPHIDDVWTKKGWIGVIGRLQSKKQTYKVSTCDGYEIITSLDHVFLTYDGINILEKRLSEIEDGDRVLLLCGNNNVKKEYIRLEQCEYKNSNDKPNNCELPDIIDEDLAYLIGYSYGDGWVERNKYGEPRTVSLACGHKYPDIQKKLEDIISNKFKYLPHSRMGGGALNKLDISNKCIVNFLDKNLLLKEKSNSINFPSKIFNSPNSVVASFICGYFDADGYASGKKKGYNFSSIRLDFLKTVQTLLMSMGILSKIHSEDRSQYGWNNLYTLYVVGSYSKDLFKKLMNKSIKVGLLEHDGKRDNWLTPYKPKELNISHNNYNFVPPDAQNISVSAYNKLLLEHPEVEIDKGILVQSIVASIEEDSFTETYDLQLESENLFWCEGFYVHNSGRRGALLLSISVHHPEVLNFIRAKRDLKKVTGANISVRITDEFMKAVVKKDDYEQRWPVDSDKPVIKQKTSAKEIWDELIKSTWLNGEPGILFWDTIIKNSPADSYASDSFASTCTNPCGELPLSPGSSCILLLQNLTSYVSNPFTKDACLNENLLKTNTRKAQKLIDDMVDLEIEAVEKIIEKVQGDPEDEKTKANELDLWQSIREACIKGRRTGLGITGLGDCLAMLNIKYGSKESLKMVEKIFSILRDEAYRSSIDMAKERGAFPIWDAKKEEDNAFLNRLPEDIRKDMKKYGRRNIACLTVSPAGSVSTQTQTSSGFEPVFMVECNRKRKLTDNDKDKPDFVDAMGDKWKNYKIEHHGLKLFKQINPGKEFKDSSYFGAQAQEIDYEARVKMQGLATTFTDHAISSTINLPNNADIKTVEKIYLMAYQEGCKGITIYRDGSRDGVLTKEASQNKKSCDDCDDAGQKLRQLVDQGQRPSKIILSPAPKRPIVLECEIHRSKVGKGDWLFFVGMLHGQPYEIFGGNAARFEKQVVIPQKFKKGWILKNGKGSNGCTQYHLVLGSLEDKNEMMQYKDINRHFNNKEYGAFTRLASLSMRHGTPIKYICEQITKEGCAGDLFSFQRAMSRILKKYISDGEKSEVECPICGSSEVAYKNGCPTCKICGNSNCS